MAVFIDNIKKTSTEGKKIAAVLVLIFLLSFAASLIQTDLGKVDVDIIQITDDNGLTITGKMYRPLLARNDRETSAVLLLHGLNNDKDTQAPTAIELSRRGLVVLSLDELGHGDSDPPEDLLEDNDNSLGANAAFHYLESLPFVDADNIGLVGHSMGGSSATAVAEANPNHKAIAFQAFGALNMSENEFFNNYLQIIPRYEESALMSRSEWIQENREMIEYNLDETGLQSSDNVFDTTFGSFNRGTAQRYALIDSTHPGGTWKKAAVTEVVAWMQQALNDQDEETARDGASDHVYYFKEVLMLVALLLAVYSIIPLFNRLIELEYFKVIRQDLPEKTFTSSTDWWKLATINALIGGVSFVILPFIGTLILGPINEIIPIFTLLIGNAFIFWFLFNAVLMHILFRRWYNKEEVEADQLGSIAQDNPDRPMIIYRSFVLAGVIFLYLYLLSGVVQSVFTVELRYMWSFFRLLRPYRFLELIIYFIPIFYFFIMNGGVFLFGQIRPEEAGDNLWKWYAKNIYATLSIFIIVFILEYVPMILFGTSPLLGGVLGIFWLLGIFLMSIIPEFMVIFFIMTYLFKKSGRIYPGSILAAILVTWIMVNGAMVL